MSSLDNTQHAEVVEHKSIDYIPASARHGKARDLFTLWFCTNIAPLPVVTGAMAVLQFHLDIVSAVTAIVLGQFAGGIVQGLSSAQGPALGIPQTIQSRAAFGRYGSLVVVAFTAFMYLGFFTSNIILAGKTIHTLIPVVPVKPGILLGAAAMTVIAVLGYNFIHKINKIGSFFMGAALLGGFLYVLLNPLPADFFSRGSFNASGWFAAFSVAAVWQIAFFPYTSDYSRYLPADSGIAKPFWYSYLGSSLGSSLAFVFGALAVSAVPQSTDAMEAVKTATGALGGVLMVLFFVNIVCHNAMNMYGAVLALLAAVQTFFFNWNPETRMRVLFSVGVMVGTVALALFASSDFVHFFLNLIFAFLSMLISWAAINLMDYFWLQKQHYDIPSVFRRDGGRYGLIRYPAFISYLAGVLVQIPFLKNTFFHGMWADLIPEVDLSWVFGLLVTAVLFWLLSAGSKRTDVSETV